jgi:hypothetical protein
MKSKPHLALLVGVIGATPLVAHHSYVEYDQDKIIEITGVLKKVEWRNPHVGFVVEVSKPGAAPVVWEIESSGINNLKRMGARVEQFTKGGKVRVAGWPSSRSAVRMYVTNIMIENARGGGTEIVMWRLSKPRWPQAVASGYGTSASDKLFTPGVAAKKGLFQVWGSNYEDPLATAGAMRFTAPNRPWTDTAREAIAAQGRATTLVGCTPKGMPTMMDQPFPIEFTQQGDRIVLRIEEYDAVRTIHLRAPAAGTALPAPSIYGHSVGHWEGETLVVETTRVKQQPYQNGVAQAADARYVERFAPTTDGSRLHYSVVVHDSAAFTQPMEFKRDWVSRPGEKVMPFNCKA